MADPFTILLFVASGEASDATTRAMERATRDALAPGSHVEVRETANQLTDDDARISEELAHADAVVYLTWGDAVHRNATLRVHIARSGRWISRSIGFMASDASKERGRTIGFAVVSMLPEAGEEQPPPIALTPPSTPNPSPPPTTPATPGLHDRPIPLPDQAPARVAPLMSSLALDLFALGAKGINGKGDGGGGGVAVSWFVRTPLSLRLGCGVRAGSIDGLHSTTFTATVSGGVAWHAVRSSALRPFGLSLRADYVLVYQSMQYFRGGTAPELADGWLSGVGAAVEPAWLFAADVEGVVGLELEDVFVPANIEVRKVPVASVAFLRAVVEMGVRVRF
jgi:hypothetical protein